MPNYTYRCQTCGAILILEKNMEEPHPIISMHIPAGIDIQSASGLADMEMCMGPLVRAFDLDSVGVIFHGDDFTKTIKLPGEGKSPDKVVERDRSET
jgi:predicted nucleic acid-binding Zn ribbon protein